MKISSLIVAASLLAGLLTACAPQAEDPGAQPVYIDSADLLIAESYPVQVRLHLVGNLPTPCHHFEAEVAAPDQQNRIEVTAYSTVDAAMRCAQVLQPIDENIAIPMDGAADGAYSVWLNGELVGEFNYPG
jgi:hypothetical protein